MNWSDESWREAGREYHKGRGRPLPQTSRPKETVDGERPRALNFVLFRDLAETSAKQWLVHDFLGESEMSVMYGKPGDGKSVLAEDLALHVAAGRDWHGRPVKQGAVVYIALERYPLVKRRAIAFRKKHKFTDLPFAIIRGVYDFRQATVIEIICEIVKEVEAATGETAVLIVIDTLARALCGGDENSAKDMGAIIAATSRLQDGMAAHVLWLHHTPLAADDRMRGHSALLGAVDTTVNVVKQADGTRTATVIKTNDGPEGEMIAFSLESVETGTNTTAPVVVPIEGLQQKPTAKQVRLTDASKIALRALQEAIAEAGETAPASNHIPEAAKVTTEKVWRQYAYKRGISSGEERAKQQAFKRAFQQLVAAQRVATWDEYVWLAR